MGLVSILRKRYIMVSAKKKNAFFGRYPCCDLLNNALRFIKEGKIDTACFEIIVAIHKAGGYFHKDIVPFVEEMQEKWRERNNND